MSTNQTIVPRRKWRNYLLDMRFQLRYTLIIMAVSASLSAGLGYLLVQKMEENRKLSGISALKGLGYTEEEIESFDSVFKEEERKEDQQFLWSLVGILASLVIILGFLGIIITHRAAGPAFVLSKFMKAVTGGNWKQIRPFRKRDDFKFLYDDFKNMTDSIRNRHEDEISQLESIKNALKEGQHEEVQSEITTIINNKRGYIED